MALNKGSNLNWLVIHCLVYSIPFIFFFGLDFAAVAFTSHLLIDFISSKITKYLWNKGERHWFFVVIGLDQALHLTVLFKLL